MNNIIFGIIVGGCAGFLSGMIGNYFELPLLARFIVFAGVFTMSYIIANWVAPSKDT